MLSLLAWSLVILGSSLASYAVWRAARSARIAERVALGVGAALFLSAATFVVITFVLAALTRSMIPDDELPQAMSGEWTGSSLGTVEAAPDTSDPNSPDTLARQADRSSPRSADRDAGVTAASEKEAEIFGFDARGKAPHADPLTSHGVESDPWLASRCVVATAVDWPSGRRWTFDNECSTPVSIVIVTCTLDDASCSAGQAAQWVYQPQGMILPAKFQRPVTEIEQTVTGVRVRYAACSMAEDRLVQLIGAGMDERASQDWQRQFKDLAASDRCIAAFGLRDGSELSWRQPETASSD